MGAGSQLIARIPRYPPAIPYLGQFIDHEISSGNIFHGEMALSSCTHERTRGFHTCVSPLLATRSEPHPLDGEDLTMTSAVNSQFRKKRLLAETKPNGRRAIADHS